jgi:hypothetical protein
MEWRDDWFCATAAGRERTALERDRSSMRQRQGAICGRAHAQGGVRDVVGSKALLLALGRALSEQRGGSIATARTKRR